jgi:hypothetical protein
MDGPFQYLLGNKILWKYHVCNVVSIRRLSYNCTVYFNRQLTDNMYHVSGDPHMCKGCRAHIRTKVIVRDDAVLASTGIPPDRESVACMWRCWRPEVHNKGCVRPHSYCFTLTLGCEEWLLR